MKNSPRNEFSIFWTKLVCHAQDRRPYMADYLVLKHALWSLWKNLKHNYLLFFTLHLLAMNGNHFNCIGKFSSDVFAKHVESCKKTWLALKNNWRTLGNSGQAATVGLKTSCQAALPICPISSGARWAPESPTATFLAAACFDERTKNAMYPSLPVKVLCQEPSLWPSIHQATSTV